MHRQFSEIPEVVVLTGLEINSGVFFVWDRDLYKVVLSGLQTETNLVHYNTGIFYVFPKPLQWQKHLQDHTSPDVDYWEYFRQILFCSFILFYSPRVGQIQIVI